MGRYNWNHVLMKYCDGASFSGNRDKPLTTKNGTTIWFRGKAVLEAFPGIVECRFSMPNKHHFLVDLAPFGQDNPGEVFFAADRPYGLIEAAVVREGVPDEPRAWAGIPGFC